jgi:hypothetical protein
MSGSYEHDHEPTGRGASHSAGYRSDLGEIMRPRFFAPVLLLAAGALALTGCSKPAAAAATDDARSITGTWTVTVHPDGPQPSFQSTITFTSAGGVVENTSKAVSSGGIGTWSRAGGGHFTTMFRKYRFDGTGTFIGTTEVTEDDLVDAGGNTYTGHATTKVIDAKGNVTMSFTSTAQAERMG